MASDGVEVELFDRLRARVTRALVPSEDLLRRLVRPGPHVGAVEELLVELPLARLALASEGRAEVAAGHAREVLHDADEVRARLGHRATQVRVAESVALPDQRFLREPQM